MAVIAHKALGSAFGLAAALLLFTNPARADRAADIRAQIGYVANALSAGNPADAMVPFDKSFSDYQKLSSYFGGLTGFQVENEIEITDEQDTDTEANVTVNWILTLSDLGTRSSTHRTGDIQFRLVLKKGKWKIVGLSPIEFFNPQQKSALKP